MAVVKLELFLLHIELAVELFLVELELVLEKHYLRLELNDCLLLVDHNLRDLLFEVIDELLLAFQFAFALLVVDAEVFVFNLNLIEQLLDLSEVLRAVFLSTSLAQLDYFLLKLLVLAYEFLQLFRVSNRRSVLSFLPLLSVLQFATVFVVSRVGYCS